MASLVRLGELFLCLGELESSSTLSAMVLPLCLSAPPFLDFHSYSTKHYRMRD